MLESSLHAGNIAAAVATVATAADLTLTGGAATAIGGALSGVALFKRAERPQKQLADRMAGALQAHLDGAHLTADRKKIAVQIFARFPPTEADLARGNMEAGTVAAALRRRVEAAETDPAFRTATALDDYERLLTATLAPFLTPRDQKDAMLQELLRRSDRSGDADRLREEGITEKAIIRLARRIAGETEDLGDAWLTLQDAMDTAVRIQQEGRAPSNHGDFVDEVLRRVAALSQDGDFASATDAIAAALAEEEAAHARRMARLLESGIELARLEGDSTRAADLLLRQADLEAGGAADVGALLELQRRYLQSGQELGLALDLRVAVEIARRARTRATGPRQHGAALNGLGMALGILGEREAGTARLEDAVAAFEGALSHWTRESAPRDWAQVQMNLGNAFRILGVHSGDPKHLEAAIAAYRCALEERTRDSEPFEWARTHMNLGTALNALGEREDGTARLKDAVTAYETALTEWTRESARRDWAMAQTNLGNSLREIGAREGGTERLEDAAAAYRAALSERPREDAPLQWALTRGNQAKLELVWFRQTRAPLHLDRAADLAGQAREVFQQTEATHYLRQVEDLLDTIDRLRDGAAS